MTVADFRAHKVIVKQVAMTGDTCIVHGSTVVNSSSIFFSLNLFFFQSYNKIRTILKEIKINLFAVFQCSKHKFSLKILNIPKRKGEVNV